MNSQEYQQQWEQELLDCARYKDYKIAFNKKSTLNMQILKKTTQFVNLKDMAAANGNLDFLKIFSENKKDDFMEMILQKNEDECIPLHWAVLNQQYEIEQLSIINSQEQTPLDLALENQDEKMVEILAEKMVYDEKELNDMPIDELNSNCIEMQEEQF